MAGAGWGYCQGALQGGGELLAAGNAPAFCPSDVAKSSFLGTPH